MVCKWCLKKAVEKWKIRPSALQGTSIVIVYHTVSAKSLSEKTDISED